MKLTTLEEAFRDIAFLCGGVFLLRPADALRFVEEHRVAAIPILGIEGFRVLEKGRIQPQQEHTADFEFEGANTHQEAKRFLEKRLNSGLWFEVVSADR
jgi:hypothetical protein